MADLDVYFLDVGQGDGTWVECPNGTKVLIDLGSKKNGEIAGQGAIAFIKSRLNGSTVIDYLFITHGDGDHYNLIPELYAAIPGLTITNVGIGGEKKDYSSWINDNVFDKATNFYLFPDCAFDPVGSPRFKFGAVSFYLLSANVPTRKAAYKNEKSLVLMVEYKGRKLILTGDAEYISEDRIVKTNYNSVPGKAFLLSFALKLGHHGSENATTEMWINALQAQAYFASGDQKWAHPYCSVYKRIEDSGYLRSSPSYDHGYICGAYDAKKKDYRWTNFDDSKYLFSNIYVVSLEVDMGTGEESWNASGSHLGYYVRTLDGKVQIASSENLSGNPPSSGWFTP